MALLQPPGAGEGEDGARLAVQGGYSWSRWRSSPRLVWPYTRGAVPSRPAVGRQQYAAPPAAGPRPAARGFRPAGRPGPWPGSFLAGAAPQPALSLEGRLTLTWAVVNGLLLLAPLPQSERLLNGWTVPLALLSRRRWAPSSPAHDAPRRGALALQRHDALLYLSLTLTGRTPPTMAPASETAAVTWLAAHTGPGDVVMASAGQRESDRLGGALPRRQRPELRDFQLGQGPARCSSVLCAAHHCRGTPVHRAPLPASRSSSEYLRAGAGALHARDKGYRPVYTYGPVRIFAVEGI